MKHIKSWISCLLIAFVLTLGLPAAYSASTVKLTAYKSGDKSYEDGDYIRKGWYIVEWGTEGSSVSKLKSSNSSVLSVSNTYIAVGDGAVKCIVAKAKKSGKATVTYRLNGKNHKKTFRVRKYVNPFAKITINGKTLKTSNFNKRSYTTVRGSKYSSTGYYTVNFQLKNGWRLNGSTSRAMHWYYSPRTYFSVSRSSVCMFEIEAKKRSTGQTEQLQIFFK